MGVDDGSDFLGEELRYFRHSLDIVKFAAGRWSEEGASFIIQVGDLIDGRNAKGDKSHAALKTVIDAFPANIPRCDVVGNHELYNFSHDDLVSSGFRIRGEGLTCDIEPAPGLVGAYSFTPDPMWEIIVLDSFDLAVEGYPDGHPKKEEATQMLTSNNPNALATGVDWFQGLPESKYRWVAFNGAVGSEQLEWFRKALHTVSEKGRKAIVVSHAPFFTPATTLKTQAWNSDEILDVLHSSDGRCVVAVLAGHDHFGGYSVDSHGIHHVTLMAPLICPAGSPGSGAGMIELYQDRAELIGYGAITTTTPKTPEGNIDRLTLKRETTPV